jgi:hypothetical protein
LEAHLRKKTKSENTLREKCPSPSIEKIQVGIFGEKEEQYFGVDGKEEAKEKSDREEREKEGGERGAPQRKLSRI